MKTEIDSLADFRGEFERVRNQVVMGNAHLELWRSLSNRLGSDQKRLAANAAPTFFGMTLESHLNTAILHAARIFDTHRDSLNIKKILKRADADKGSLSPGAPPEENLRPNVSKAGEAAGKPSAAKPLAVNGRLSRRVILLFVLLSRSRISSSHCSAARCPT